MKPLSHYLENSKLRQIALLRVEQFCLPYYQSLAVREQRILLFAAVVLPIMIFIFGVVLPLCDARQGKLQALSQLTEQAVEAEILAAGLQKNGPVRSPQNPMAVADSIAKETQISQFVTRMRPQIGGGGGQRLLIQVRSAPYRKVVGFLDRLSKEGLSLQRVKMQRAKVSGTVHLQIVVE